MTTTRDPIATRTLDGALAAFLRAQAGKNRRHAMPAAYRTDLAQFIAWLRKTHRRCRRTPHLYATDQAARS